MFKNEFYFIFMCKGYARDMQKSYSVWSPSLDMWETGTSNWKLQYYIIEVKTTMLTCTSRAWGNQEEWARNQAHSPNHKAASTSLCLCHPISNTHWWFTTIPYIYLDRTLYHNACILQMTFWWWIVMGRKM